MIAITPHPPNRIDDLKRNGALITFLLRMGVLDQIRIASVCITTTYVLYPHASTQRTVSGSLLSNSTITSELVMKRRK